jgi:hypothetical protein
MRHRILTAMLAAAAACDGTAPSASAKEELLAHEEPPPPPESATPGSLGGICGIEYINCREPQSTLNQFRNLPESSRGATCTIDSVTKRQAISWRTTRLVNDHTGPVDFLEARIESTILNGGLSQLVLNRNGVDVANGLFTDDTVVFENVDVLRGGAEVVLAFGADIKNLERLQSGSGDCNAYVQCSTDRLGFDCWICRGHKALVLGVLGAAALGLRAAVAAEEAILGLVGAAGTASSLLGDAFDCGKDCRISECNVDRCGCSSERDSPACDRALAACCMNAGGKCSNPIGTGEVCGRCFIGFGSR